MKNYSRILADMMANIPADLDKREGGVIYTAIVPCAAELAAQYIDLECILELAFASTSLGDYLELRTSEMGISRLPATKATKTGTFAAFGNVLMDIPLDSRFGIDGLIFTAVKKLSTGVFELEFETAGSIGNAPTGAMLPIAYIANLSTATLSGIIEAGTDIETDEKLLSRYHLKVREPTTSGNAFHYKAWALEVIGVGDAKIFPLWNGNGTVKVVIVDGDKLPAPASLVADVVSHIAEVRPIGSTVTVVSGKAKTINLTAGVILAVGFSLATVTDSLKTALKSYYSEVAFAASFVSYAKVGLVILGVAGVLDYNNLTLSGAQGNVKLAAEEIPTLGTTTLTVTKV